LFLLLLPAYISFAQDSPKGGPDAGRIGGNVSDMENASALADVTISLFRLPDTIPVMTRHTDNDGAFLFEHVGAGYYRIVFRSKGYALLKIDSIHVRDERADFNLADIKLARTVTEMESVIIYAEKPLYENKDGKLTFNAGESALSNSSTTSELLKQTPLVDVDPEGKVLLRGKEVKILIDDKPVDLDARQLQDLLESMPGSMIEKIEVLTTPPPQYANERGGVINIVTKKGNAGINGRVNVNYGTRGEAGTNGSIGYRKKGFVMNVSGGFSYNAYKGSSYSNRRNVYPDSTNYFNTSGQSNSHNKRPNGRLSVDYDLNKRNNIGFSFLYNAAGNTGETNTQYANINRFGDVYKLSRRNVLSASESGSPSFNLSYTWKGKDPREVLRILSGVNLNANTNDRNFYQQYLNVDSSFNGADSAQRQNTTVKNHTVNLRINYDKPLRDKKTSLNFGTTYSYYTSHNRLYTAFMKKPENVFIPNSLLSNDFRFFQKVYGLRAAVRYTFVQDFYAELGLLEEYAETNFDLQHNSGDFRNKYFSSLPFVTVRKKWPSEYSLTLSYKRTVQRPGIGQLNPSVDYSDPYNTRFGNPFLRPYYADNFDLITGYWNKLYNLNLSMGYNCLSDIYSSIRILQPDGKTTITWQNISGRKEYESHFWGGLTLNKKARLNMGIGYSYNVYSLHDRVFNKFRNGGSLNSSLNGNYQFSKTFNATSSFTYNRFANPQGTVRNTLSMNIGIQQKLLKNKLTVSMSIVDPFRTQQNNYSIYGSNYVLESFSKTNSRNLRIAAGYSFKKNTKKAVKKKPAVAA
jgi:hypothetical protein